LPLRRSSLPALAESVNARSLLAKETPPPLLVRPSKRELKFDQPGEPVHAD
jgi:hypothetical protein